MTHAEIAAILGITEDGARQHLHRARIRVNRETSGSAPDVHDAALDRFLTALEKGDLTEVQQQLAADAVAYSDGGGKARAARHPIVGVDQVIRFFGTLRRHLRVRAVGKVEANGQTAVLLWFGRQYMLVALDVREDQIREIHSILNPDKLSYLQRQLTESHTQ